MQQITNTHILAIININFLFNDVRYASQIIPGKDGIQPSLEKMKMIVASDLNSTLYLI